MNAPAPVIDSVLVLLSGLYRLVRVIAPPLLDGAMRESSSSVTMTAVCIFMVVKTS
jgi:hypothetical protein